MKKGFNKKVSKDLAKCPMCKQWEILYENVKEQCDLFIFECQMHRDLSSLAIKAKQLAKIVKDYEERK